MRKGSGLNIPDYLQSKKHSERLRDNILSWWRKRDRDVKVWVETHHYKDGKGRMRTMYFVRSNIVIRLPE